jgi:hypothetical protein
MSAPWAEGDKSIRWLCLSCGWSSDCPMPGFAGSGGVEHRHYRGSFGCGPLVGFLKHGSHDYCGGTGIVLYAGEGDYMELRTCSCNPIQRTVGATRISNTSVVDRPAGVLREVSRD